MTAIDLAFVVLVAAMNGTQTLLLGLALGEILKRSSLRRPELDAARLSSIRTPPITIIAPAFNEEKNIEESVRALLQVEYPNLTIIVVNDGSRDATFARLQSRFALEPLELIVRTNLATAPVRGLHRSLLYDRLLVIDKANGGKADALNAGLNAARTLLVCCVDADSVIHRRALLRMIEPFICEDGALVALGGAVLPANGCQIRDGVVEKVGLPSSWLARFQMIEYLRSFVFARIGWNGLGGSLIISGAFGLFRRDAIIAAGGYRTNTVGEDAELVSRLHRALRDLDHPCRVAHIPDPVCLTEVPESVGMLGRQRDRWQRGLLDTLVRHRGLFLRPRYGLLGLVGLPLFVLCELVGPLAELFGYFWLARTVLRRGIDQPFAAAFLCVALLWGVLLSVLTLCLEAIDRPGARSLRHQAALLAVALLEGFGYRQLTLWFRLRGCWKWVIGETSWGDMRRQGLARQQESGAVK